MFLELTQQNVVAFRFFWLLVLPVVRGGVGPQYLPVRGTKIPSKGGVLINDVVIRTQVYRSHLIMVFKAVMICVYLCLPVHSARGLLRLFEINDFSFSN